MLNSNPDGHQHASDPASPTAPRLVKQLSKNGNGAVVVQIIPSLVCGGAERGTIEIAGAIVAAGGKAVVISNGGAMQHHLAKCGAIHYQLPVNVKNPFKWGALRRQIGTILEDENADIVHVRSRAPAWIALPVAQKMGLITVSTVHGRLHATSMLKRIYNAKMLKTDHVIAISHYSQSLITRGYAGVEAKMSVIHRGVDTEMFDATQVSPSRIKRFVDEMALPKNMPPNMPLVMLPARPTESKGHEMLLEALAKIKDLPFLGVFVGAADGRQSFIDRIMQKGTELGLEGRIRLVSAVEDMPAALMAADVVTMPYTVPEPFGRVALEAQAMGKPVIAFNHGGAVESIDHERTGWLAKPNDANDLSRCLKTALTLSATRRQALAREARSRIERSFSAAKMCRETINVYARLLATAAKLRNQP